MITALAAAAEGAENIVGHGLCRFGHGENINVSVVLFSDQNDFVADVYLAVNVGGVDDDIIHGDLAEYWAELTMYQDTAVVA